MFVIGTLETIALLAASSEFSLPFETLGDMVLILFQVALLSGAGLRGEKPLKYLDQEEKNEFPRYSVSISQKREGIIVFSTCKSHVNIRHTADKFRSM